MDLNQRTVIVTGAGSGIGRALALEFARHKANVVCCARRKNRLDETVALIEAENGHALAVPVDITDETQVARTVDTVLKNFGRLDVLFNNAGSFASIAGVHEADATLWWRDVTVNLLGSMLMIRYVLPHMIERNEGIIINMNGGRPVGGTGYACGKAGLMELTRILVKELEMQNSNVMVFNAGPGLVKTEMTQLQADSDAGQKWIPSTRDSFDAGKERKPEDIAQATMKLIAIARPELSGRSFGPDTDFSTFGEN